MSESNEAKGPTLVVSFIELTHLTFFGEVTKINRWCGGAAVRRCGGAASVLQSHITYM